MREVMIDITLGNFRTISTPIQRANSVNFQSNSLEHLVQLSTVNMKEEIKARISEKNEFAYQYEPI